MPEFIPGLKLSEIFYTEAVKPLLHKHFPEMPHTACRIDSGSEVLGFDTEMSRDHDWGLRLQLFIGERDFERYAGEIDQCFSQNLPRMVRGYPTNFDEVIEPDGGVSTTSIGREGVPIKHRVHISTIRIFFRDYLAWDIDSAITPADWLTFPTQHLRTITHGAVYHDDLCLETVRMKLTFYPHDLWLYTLAAGWQRIGQEEHLMPRAGYAGDELGSAIIGSRLVRDIMRLCFLMEKQYPPYAKWFGTAFQRLDCAASFMPLLREAQQAETWQAREQPLTKAYEFLAQMHNALGITEPLPTLASQFFTRPFRVIWGSRFANTLLEQINDPEVKAIAARTLIGSIDQFLDSTDALFPHLRQTFKEFYRVPVRSESN